MLAVGESPVEKKNVMQLLRQSLQTNKQQQQKKKKGSMLRKQRGGQRLLLLLHSAKAVFFFFFLVGLKQTKKKIPFSLYICVF